jgi:hypothetical protein
MAQDTSPEPTAQMEPGAADGQAHELTVIKIRCDEKPQRYSVDTEPCANGRVGGGSRKVSGRFSRLHTLRKIRGRFANTSIHRLCADKVWVRWWGSGVVVGS